jgi:hypothetical protein
VIIRCLHPPEAGEHLLEEGKLVECLEKLHGLSEVYQWATLKETLACSD